MEIPALLAAQQAITQQNVAMSLMKKQAQADQQVANILMDAVTAVRGNNVNISA